MSKKIKKKDLIKNGFIEHNVLKNLYYLNITNKLKLGVNKKNKELCLFYSIENNSHLKFVKLDYEYSWDGTALAIYDLLDVPFNFDLKYINNIPFGTKCIINSNYNCFNKGDFGVVIKQDQDYRYNYMVINSNGHTEWIHIDDIGIKTK